MNLHRRVFLALALTVAGTTFAAADDLAGIWSAQERTKGGLGAQWVFSGNEEMTVTFGALVDFTYTIKGDRITTTSTEAPALPPDAEGIEFAIEGNTMTQALSTGERRVLQRAGSLRADAHPIVGDWTYPHPTGPTALMRYSRDDIAQLSVPFQTRKGTYRLNGNVLELERQGQRTLTFDMVRQDRVLILTERGSGRVRRFTKFEY